MKTKKTLESEFNVSCILFVLASQNKPIGQIDSSGPLRTGQGKGDDWVLEREWVHYFKIWVNQKKTVVGINWVQTVRKKQLHWIKKKPKLLIQTKGVKATQTATSE